MDKNIELNGNRFTRQNCSKSKNAAKKEAEKIRESGRLARVIQDKKNKTYCVYKGRKRK